MAASCRAALRAAMGACQPVERGRRAGHLHWGVDRFLSIEAFVRVAQSQSFAEAARQLRLSKSVVTARVQQLEDLLGGPLFHRTTRAVRLSEMGQAFYRDCHELVSRTNEIVDQMREVRGSPAGLLRVHVLTGFALGHSHMGAPAARLPGALPRGGARPVRQRGGDRPGEGGLRRRAADLSRRIGGAGVAPVVSGAPIVLRIARLPAAPRHAAAAERSVRPPARPVLGLSDARPLGVLPRARRRQRRRDHHAGPEADADEQLGAPAARLRLRSTPAWSACRRWWPPTRSSRASCRWCCRSSSCRRSGCRRCTRAPSAAPSSPSCSSSAWPKRSPHGEPPWDRELIGRGLISARLIEA